MGIQLFDSGWRTYRQRQHHQRQQRRRQHSGQRRRRQRRPRSYLQHTCSQWITLTANLLKLLCANLYLTYVHTRFSHVMNFDRAELSSDVPAAAAAAAAAAADHTKQTSDSGICDKISTPCINFIVVALIFISQNNPHCVHGKRCIMECSMCAGQQLCIYRWPKTTACSDLHRCSGQRQQRQLHHQRQQRQQHRQRLQRRQHHPHHQRHLGTGTLREQEPAVASPARYYMPTRHLRCVFSCCKHNMVANNQLRQPPGRHSRHYAQKHDAYFHRFINGM